MKNKIMLLMLISTLSFATGKISFKEQSKIEQSSKIEKNEIKNQQNSNLMTNTMSNEDKIRDKIVEFAKSQIGKPYVWGAAGVGGSFDCSGFTQYVMKKFGILIPRVSAEQSVFKPKLHSGIKKGDLLFFETLGKGRISHVGIYAGNRQFIHASSKSKRITISEFSGFYAQKFRWAISVI